MSDNSLTTLNGSQAGLSEGREAIQLFCEGWPIKSLSAKFHRSPEGIEAMLRHELIESREASRSADTLPTRPDVV